MAKRNFNRREAAKAIAEMLRLPTSELTDLTTKILENTREIDGLFKLHADLKTVEDLIAPAVMSVREEWVREDGQEGSELNVYTTRGVQHVAVDLPFLTSSKASISNLEDVLQAVGDLPVALAPRRDTIGRQLRAILKDRRINPGSDDKVEIRPFIPDEV